MKGLILNDLLSIRRMLKTLAVIFLIFMVAWAVGGQPATGAMMLCIMGASYILNLFSYDEFYHWEKYLRVMPVSTKQVVMSRYATFGIMASATAAISTVYLLVDDKDSCHKQSRRHTQYQHENQPSLLDAPLVRHRNHHRGKVDVQHHRHQ